MALDGIRSATALLVNHLDGARPVREFQPVPLAKTSPSGSSSAEPVLTVEVNTFIPMDQVSTPWGVPGGGTFAGDDRGIGEEGTHRTQQTIQVFEDPTSPTGYRVVIEADIGETHRLNGDGEVTEVGQASESDLQGEVVEVRDDGTIVVKLTCQSPNPLVGVAPGISYEMTVAMSPNPDGTWSVVSTGEHDGFPGYEVLASVDGGLQQVTYGYDPRISDANALDLANGDGGVVEFVFGGSSVEVDGSLTVGSELPTPETMLERHTQDGVVDGTALGADLADQAEAGNVDQAFIDEVFSALPPDQQEAAANAFFDNLSGTPAPDFHQVGGVMEYSTLSLTPEGMNLILSVGQYAPERLGDQQVLYGFANQNAEAIWEGDPEACVTATAYLEALANDPDSQERLIRYIEPDRSDLEQMQSTPEGRALLSLIERILS